MIDPFALFLFLIILNLVWICISILLVIILKSRLLNEYIVDMNVFTILLTLGPLGIFFVILKKINESRYKTTDIVFK